MTSALNKVLGARGSLKGQLLRGGIGNGVLKISYLLIQFIVTVLLARSLSPSGFGEYAFALAVVQLAVVISQFGFPNYLVKCVAVYKSKADWGRFRGVVSFANIFVVVLSILVGLALWSDTAVLEGYFLSLDDKVVFPLVVLVVLLSVLGNLSAVLRGFGFVVKGNISEQLVRPAVLLIAVALVVSLKGISPAEALWINVVATLISIAVGLSYVRRDVLPAVPSHTKKLEAGYWTKSSLAFLLLAGAQVVNHQADLLMLGLLTTNESVGLYRVSVQLVDGLGVLFFAISVAIGPKIAALYASGDWHSVKTILRVSHRVAVGLMVLPCALLIYFSAEVIRLAFGAGYELAATSLSILLFGKVVYAGFAFSGLALSMTAWARAAALITGFAVAVNVILNLVLIPIYGIEGAAVATAFSSVLANLLGVYWLKRRLGDNVSAYGLG